MQTDEKELKNVIEGILFVSGQGVELKDIAEKLEIELEKVKETIEDLKEEYSKKGINIITYKNSVQMCSNPIYADDISTVLNPIREKQLTKATMETLAIIAYKQPVTKLDVEQIRGFNSDYAMQVLTTFKLIEVVGRKDAVGKPLLYATTDEFLKRFELSSLEDLPDYDELLERIKVLHSDQKAGDGLYGSTEIIPEEQLLDKKEEKIEDKENQSTKNKKIVKENEKKSSQKEKVLSESEVIDTLLFQEQSDIIGKDDFEIKDVL